MSWPARDQWNLAVDRRRARMGSRLTMYAEKRNVSPSSHRASDSGLCLKYGTDRPSPTAAPARAVNSRPPRGSVPYVVAMPTVFAFTIWRRGTRFGTEESLAGTHTRARHSMKNDRTYSPHSAPMNGIDTYIRQRAMSAEIMRCLRSSRSTRTPANGPNSTEGNIRAAMTPATA